MKGLLLLSLMALGLGADAQSLKDLLYSGKLKKDSSGVIRRTDDLSTKIDTVQKKPVADTVSVTVQEGTRVATEVGSTGVLTTAPDTTVAVPTGGEATPDKPAAPAKSNTKLWREHTDAMTTSLKTEVLPNKKIKKGTYYFIADYELHADGRVEILNVTVSPENDILLDGVKSWLMNNELRLAPAVDGNGQAKKVKRKQSFSLMKE